MIARSNKTMATASLNKLSPSIKTARRLLTPRSRNKAITATGSVADMSAPKANAAGTANDNSGTRVLPATRIIMPTMNVPRKVPTKANIKIGARYFLRVSH